MGDVTHVALVGTTMVLGGGECCECRFQWYLQTANVLSKHKAVAVCAAWHKGRRRRWMLDEELEGARPRRQVLRAFMRAWVNASFAGQASTKPTRGLVLDEIPNPSPRPMTKAR